ncbi:MAG: transcription-repair coupling factor [Planctomycetaceae bacterium]|nr:transcription-repair coupling factor [Planctomycetaceae bacterium]
MSFSKTLTAAMLPELLLRYQPLTRSVETFLSGKPVSIDGAVGSSHALFAASVVSAAKTKHKKAPLLIAVSTQEQAEQFADDLTLFLGKQDNKENGILFFPALDNLPKNFLSAASSGEDETESSIFVLGDDSFGQRLHCLKQLVSLLPETAVILTTLPALLHPCPPPELLRQRLHTLKVGEEVSLESLRRFLVSGGYHPTTAVDLPGEFAVRGFILDLFAPEWNKPVRLEFFGDEIESIRCFDIATQRSLDSVDEISFTQILPEEAAGASFFDYIPSDAPVLLFEPQELEKSGRQELERYNNPPSLPTVSGVLKELLTHPVLTVSNLSAGIEEEHCRLPVMSVERLHGQLESVRREINLLENERIILLCPTDTETQRFAALFADLKPALEKRLFFETGYITKGFRLLSQTISEDSTGDIIIIGSSELFERYDVRVPKRRHLGQVIDSFLDLQPGDYVVHLAHGIAKYRGIELMKNGQQEEENLKLEFDGNQVLYVPLSRIALVQKYVAGAKFKPKLAKIGGKSWQRQKQDVQAAVFDLAEEMIELQANREALPGTAFAADSDWQKEFDAAFPFRETNDQLIAIEAVKQDMERSRPMDRLLCGDVGFGKTEVAVRAAFKAVDSGYQVAVLVPTTILAEQHTRTFSERMKNFPLTIATLSRFQTKLEQKQIIEEIASGKVDIVIGTHRLVTADLKFKQLGLVVIDEEQRFGVAHKERLKQYRANTDVLTMTATPIPRTLHLSLLGIREISNLETPPENRLAVETRVIRFNDDIIRNAVLRELNRNGQIYFVHNRISDIEEFAQRIQHIVPECRIGIGHAKMSNDKLENVMHAFIGHKFDMLISTTIIESGLDIPNANTIFIDEADKYGLADLHQLRGRVGRDKYQAYCYLVLPRTQMLSSVAAERLRALEEYAHLGSGFHIAMRDLEIRGAGNILGTQQSGHINAVGYEMYCQFLETAVRTLKRIKPKETVDVQVDLPGTALIPMKYVADHRFKIDLYRRLTRAATLEEWSDLQAEVVDRFGPPPIEMQRLLQQSKIRVLAHRYRIRSVRLEDGIGNDSGYLVLQYVSETKFDELAKALKRNAYEVRTTDDRCAYIPLPEDLTKQSPPEAILEYVTKVLEF